MNTFFHSWRRKTGCVMLIMALTMFAMWMRSRVMEDKLVWTMKDVAHVLNSEDGGVSWTTYNEPRESIADYWYGSIPLKVFPCDGWWQLMDQCETHWKFEAAGFCFGSATKIGYLNPIRANYWLIPYWSLTTPLSLLSTWLLLTRPRSIPKSGFRSVGES